jgi:predicted O-methyltransferase YrrM
MTLEEQLKLDDGHRFQKKLGELIGVNKFQNIMETGSGVSSIYVLKAFDDYGVDGILHSIDPAKWYPHEIEHPKFNPIKEKSVDAIVSLYLNVGAFDVCVLDGDHEILCQTYEYEMCWHCLKPGGYLIADDVDWNNNGAWRTFLAAYKLEDELFDNARVVQKPMDAPVLGMEVTEFGTSLDKQNVKDFHENWLSYCEKLEKEWLAAGNKKHPAFDL